MDYHKRRAVFVGTANQDTYIGGEGIGPAPCIVLPEKHARVVAALRKIVDTEYWKGVEMQQIAREALSDISRNDSTEA